jgi:hypothetical protein
MMSSTYFVMNDLVLYSRKEYFKIQFTPCISYTMTYNFIIASKVVKHNQTLQCLDTDHLQKYPRGSGLEYILHIPLCIVRSEWMGGPSDKTKKKRKKKKRTLKTEVPCHSRCGTIKIPPCSKVLSAENQSIIQPSTIQFTNTDHLQCNSPTCPCEVSLMAQSG